MLAIVRKVMDGFPHLRRLVPVADRGLLSLDNLEALQAIHLNLDKRPSKAKGKEPAAWPRAAGWRQSGKPVQQDLRPL